MFLFPNCFKISRKIIHGPHDKMMIIRDKENDRGSEKVLVEYRQYNDMNMNSNRFGFSDVIFVLILVLCIQPVSKIRVKKGLSRRGRTDWQTYS